MEVPRLGGLGSCSCRPTPQPLQSQIRAASATCTTVHGNTGSLTHWAKPGIEPTTSWFLVGFVIYWATTGTPRNDIFCGIHSTEGTGNTENRKDVISEDHPARKIGLTKGNSKHETKWPLAVLCDVAIKTSSFFGVRQVGSKVWLWLTSCHFSRLLDVAETNFSDL